MSMPRVSAVIPYYNNGRTLRRCLQSFANEQTVALHEIIVVDDGSAAPAGPQLASLDLKVPVKLITTAHLGQSGATNVGLTHATGEVVLLSCADIVAVPDLVAVHAAEHAKARQEGVALGVMGGIAYAPWLKMTPFLAFLAEDGPQFCFGAITEPENVSGQLLYSPNFSVGREAIARVGGFDEAFPYGFQDTDLGLRLSATGVVWRYRPQALAHHDHPNDLANFMRRNRSIGRYLYPISRRYPPMFNPMGLRASATLLARNPDLPATLLETSRRYERFVARTGSFAPKHRQALFGLYAQAVGIAFLQGVYEGDAAVAEYMGIGRSSWEQYRDRVSAAAKVSAGPPLAGAGRVAAQVA